MDIETLFIDFDDSFSLNICGDLHSLKVSFKIVNFKDVEEIIIDPQCNYNIILGPGPGHPLEYEKVINFIRPMIENNNIFFMGICLGHQIISHLLGGDLFYLPKPVHGQSIPLPKVQYFKNLDVQSVQYYNSLAIKEDLNNNAVETISQRGQIISLRRENLITYQFHPESVGTDNSLIFYQPMLKWNEQKTSGNIFLN